MRRRGIAAALLAAGVLAAGCSSNDTSAKSNTGVVSRTSAPKGTGSVAATAPDETMQDLPSGYPGPAHPQRDPNAPQYLGALKQNQLPYSGNGDNALSIGEYVCAATRDGLDADRINTNVLAMASNELQLANSQFPAEDATKIYVDSARKTLCA